MGLPFRDCDHASGAGTGGPGRCNGIGFSGAEECPFRRTGRPAALQALCAPERTPVPATGGAGLVARPENSGTLPRQTAAVNWRDSGSHRWQLLGSY
ncbi:MAG: hypothetical protein ACLU38_15085 [Dysosmobacter sp.]